MVKKLSAYKIYLLFSAITAMCFSLVATVMIVYHIEKVHLNPLQLILVGTTLEAACFIFEIPTGIVADVYSRKLSIVIGAVLTGLGFILEGIKKEQVILADGTVSDIYDYRLLKEEYNARISEKISSPKR